MNIQLHSKAGIHHAIQRGDGPVVFFLHGFPDNNHSFDLQLDALVEAGFRCIIPVMRGYEPSSIPKDKNYSLLALSGDLEAWRVQLKLDHFHLIGHDWGALTAYIYAAQYGNHLLSLTTMAIPPLNELQRVFYRTPKQYKNSAYIALFQLRGVAEWLYTRRDFALMQGLWNRWSPGFPASSLESVKNTFRQPGVVIAALSYYRCLLRDVLCGRVDRLLTQSIVTPTLVLAGENDGCMDISLYSKAIKDQYFSGGLEFQSFAGAGHFLHQEIPEIVNPVLIEWLQSHHSSIAA